MKAQFLVTVEGEWYYNDVPATPYAAAQRLRAAAREEFNFLANRVTVKLVSQASTKSAQDDGEKQ